MSLVPARRAEPGLQVLAPVEPGFERVLTPDALAFVADLAHTFTPGIDELLARRGAQQARYDAGELPRFLDETASVRAGDWTVGPIPADLLDRRVEITGPVDRKMVINALNSGANTFMADFEDSHAPTWRATIHGQMNLMDAVRRTISYDAPDTGKHYALCDRPATLLVRPRGWHLWERHVSLAGRAVPGALFDFGLYLFHNAHELLARETGPYFYLPKLQGHLEARLWNQVFTHAEHALGLPVGTIKATVLIETLPAAFEMDEILYELRDHVVGLNCGRWDYIFSYIKTLRERPDRVLPDRGQVTMDQPFMRAYTQLLVKTCHRRRAFAMGGMAAQIPIKDDPERNERALAKVRNDKLREVTDGHDGTWVAHPGLVPVAMAVFDAHLAGPNQLDVLRTDVNVTADDLLAVPSGTRTLEGLRHDVRVGVRYLEAWLGGVGCVPLYDLMEDAATAEISRAQVWQWLRHHARLEDGQVVTAALFRQVLADEVDQIRREVGDERFHAGRFKAAAALFELLSTAERFEEFLTLPAYEILTQNNG